MKPFIARVTFDVAQTAGGEAGRMSVSGTKIQWTDATWNPTRGCSIVSAGCTNCYAMGIAHRFSGPGQPYEGLTRISGGRAVWTGDVRLVPEKLLEPLKWRKPRRIFVDSMSDLFHEQVPFDYIDQVFAVMHLAEQHTFQILTKRPERMAEYVLTRPRTDSVRPENAVILTEEGRADSHYSVPWPLPNVWAGTSCENRASANERIPHLLRTPAAVRFLSCEPLLSHIDLSKFIGTNDFSGSGGSDAEHEGDAGPVPVRLARAARGRKRKDMAGNCTGGHGQGEGLSAPAIYRGGESLQHRSASSSLDDHPRSLRAAGTGSQPQRRRPIKQQAGEPRGGVEKLQCGARTAQSRQTQTAQSPRRETDAHSGIGDSRALQDRVAIEGRDRAQVRSDYEDGPQYRDAGEMAGDTRPDIQFSTSAGRPLGGIDWIIAGGESGPRARPCQIEWIRSIRDQCKAAGVPCFVKQLGARPESDGKRWYLADSHGGDWDEWPKDLRVREYPQNRLLEARRES